MRRAGWLLLTAAGCLRPDSFPAPPPPPPDTKLELIVARGPSSKTSVELREMDFEAPIEKTSPDGVAILYYRCDAAELGVGRLGAAPHPLPATFAGRVWSGGGWSNLDDVALEQVRRWTELEHQDLSCRDLLAGEELLAPVAPAPGVFNGAWLDPESLQVVAADESGALWQIGPGRPATRIPLDPGVRASIVAHHPTEARVYGYGLAEGPGGKGLTVFSVERDGAVAYRSRHAPFPDPSFDSQGANTRLALAPGAPLELYAMNLFGGLASWTEAEGWQLIAPPQEQQVLTDLLVLGRGDLLVIGQCERIVAEFSSSGKFGCDRSVAHFVRTATTWAREDEATPREHLLNSMAQAKDGSVYAGTSDGRIFLRPAGQTAWVGLGDIGSTESVEVLVPFEDGVAAGIDDFGLMRVRGPNTPRCPPIRTRLHNRTLLAHGSQLALVGQVPSATLLGIQYAEATFFDCRLPSLVEVE